MAADTSTKAETRTRALADRLEQAGFNGKVNVERTDARFFSSGQTMFPVRVFVSLSARGPNYWTTATASPSAPHCPPRRTTRPPSSRVATSTGVSTRAAASRARSSR